MTPDSIRAIVMAVLMSLGVDTTSITNRVSTSYLVADSIRRTEWKSDYVVPADSCVAIQDRMKLRQQWYLHTIPLNRGHIVRIDTTEAPPMPIPVVIPDFRVFDTVWSCDE
ncbi:MAG TPA: hypothetical protein DCZ63_11470 [Geobacter sp.]|nr:hypothetical protein [Geobacter sp.]